MHPGSSPRWRDCSRPATGPGSRSSLDLDKPFAGLWAAARAAASRTTRPPRPTGSRPCGCWATPRRRNPDDRDLLVELLRPQVPVGLQQAAVTALGRDHGREGRRPLGPRLEEALPAGPRRDPRRAAQPRGLDRSLLSSLEDGCVPPAEIDPARRQRLLDRPRSRARARAEAVFAHQAKPRQAVVDAYRSALGIKGDRAAGAAVFQKLCASCHRLSNEGSRSARTWPRSTTSRPSRS